MCSSATPNSEGAARRRFAAARAMQGLLGQVLGRAVYVRLVAPMPLRVLTWNLMHGRATAPAGRELLEQFAVAIGGWEWDVALLQEVPPWWPLALGERLRADHRQVLTSRNALRPLRRAIAIRWPDLIKSNGGGANAILVRSAVGIVEHRMRRLCWWPERRWVHAVRLHGGMWVANVHTASEAGQGRLAAETVLAWTGGVPVVLGGDFNVRELSLTGLHRGGGHGVDQVFLGGGLAVDGPAEVLERGRLSDHAPVRVSVMKQCSI
jgi:endonuclease/exonuclease/phosphatase family metal-dependent hydrolase